MQVSTDHFADARAFELSPHEEKIVTAIAAACMPPSTFLEGGGRGTVERLKRFMRGAIPDFQKSLRAMFWMVESASIPSRGRPFTMLSRDDAESFLDAWANGRT